MTDLMKESLQLTDEEVISAITSFLKDLNFEKDRRVRKSYQKKRLSKIMEELATNGSK